MASNTEKEFIDQLRDSVNSYEPFEPNSDEANTKYDDKRLNDPEYCKRLAATLAKKYLIEHNIPLEE